MMSKILVFGAGGHSRVIQEIIMQHGDCEIEAIVVSAIFDPSDRKWPAPLLAEKDLKKTTATQAVLALGNNELRERIYKDIMKIRDFTFPSLVHKSAVVSPEAVLESGSIVMAGCIIQNGAKLKEHCFVNTGATIDHDCSIGRFASIGPGSRLAGNVQVGDYTMIGIGSSIIEGIEIGERSIVGAGSVVVKNIPSNITAFGNPCREKLGVVP